jgi:hypothetical protein
MLYKGTGGNTVFSTKSTESIPVHVPISYYLSIKKGDKVTDSITLPNEPEHVNYQFINEHDLTFSISGSKIHRRGIDRKVSITISGRSGVANKYHWRMPAGAKSLDPQEIFTEFENFLKHDHENNTGGHFRGHLRDSNRPDTSASLTFTDLLTGVRFYDCVPTAFTYSRSVEASRFGYEWNLELISYSEVHFFTEQGVIASFFDRFTSIVNSIASIVDKYTAVIRSAKAYVLSPIKNALGAVNKLVNAVENFAQAIPDAIASIRGLFTAIKNEINNVFNGVVASVEAIKSIADDELFDGKYWGEVWGDWSDGQNMVDIFSDNALPPANDTSATPILQEVSNALQALEYDMNRALGYLGRVSTSNTLPVGSGGSFLDKEDAFKLLAGENQASLVGNDLDRESQAYEVYILKAGENLYDVAVNVFGDVSQWFSIAQANNWLDAHTDEAGNLPRAGKRILIPNDEGQALLTLSPQLVGGQSPLLTDLLLDDGDLKLNHGLNDIKLVTGENNFVQAIINRLSTVKGELPLNLDYGLLDSIGTQNTSKAGTQLALDVIEQVTSDERVLSINNVNIQQQGDTLDLYFNASPVNGEAVNMILPLKGGI